MARRSPPRSSRATPPPPPPEAPLAAELLRAPGSFFERLRAVPPVPSRYMAPVLLTAVLAGGLYALLLRPVVEAAAGQAGTAPALFSHANNVFGSFFLTVCTAAVMSGLGWVGAGREGRPAEVYGATFVLLPPLYMLLAALLLISPAPALTPLPEGEDALTLQRAVLASVAQAPLSRVVVLAMLLGTAAQAALAYRGFLALTAQPRRALLGALLPLVPALLLTALGVLPLLTAMF